MNPEQKFSIQPITPPHKFEPKKSRISPEAIVLLRISIEAARRIQEALPEIADDYSNHLTVPEIIKKYDIQTRFGLTNIDAAKHAVRSALGGHDGQPSVLGIDPFPGLITDQESFRKIGKQHVNDVGTHNLRNITDEQRKRGGKISGKKAKELGTGIHAFTAEQIKESSKKGILALGRTPMSEQERNLIESLSKDPRFGRKGFPLQSDAKMIRDAVNEAFHEKKPVRNTQSIRQTLSNLRRLYRKRTEFGAS